MNEAVRLFFAVSALILVAMLSTPMGGIQGGDTRLAGETQVREIASVSNSHTVKTQKKAQKDKKKNMTTKKIDKIAKASRKVARRG